MSIVKRWLKNTAGSAGGFALPCGISCILGGVRRSAEPSLCLLPRSLKILICALVSLAFCSHGMGSVGDGAIPTRIVSLAPCYDETLIELGLKEKMVGVTTASDYLDEVKNVASVGSYMKPNIETIISLKPDIVFATGFAGQAAVVEKLTALRIRVITIEMQKTEDIFAIVKQVGDVCGAQRRAEDVIGRMNEVIRQTRRKAEGRPRPRVYVEAGWDPLFTCGRGSFIHDLVEIAGGTNIAGEINQPYPRISLEFILSHDPEVIILPYMGRDLGKESVRNRKGWEGIAAVKTGRIYDDIGSNAITIPSPRLILYGLPELLKRIHPGTKEGEQ